MSVTGGSGLGRDLASLAVPMTARGLTEIARRVADDGCAPFADRVRAVGVIHRARHGLRIDVHDAWAVRWAHRRHRRWAITQAERGREGRFD
jgi:hypothetical protein